MKTIYRGKTKDVLLCDDGNILLRFKDTVTGTGNVIDAGSNTVIGEVAGKGNSSFRLTMYFFNLLKKAGMETHFIAPGPEPNTMLVKRARTFGRGLEVVCREKAWGSFIRRYGDYVEQGAPLPSLVEFTLKDDERGDPPISEDSLVVLKIATADQIRFMKETARGATAILKADLARKGLDLVDLKYEFGEVDGKTMIIDEISGDGMRAVRDGKVVLQTELAAILLG